MAQRGNIYSSLYQSDSDTEDQKPPDDTSHDNIIEINTLESNTETNDDLEIARLLAIDSEHEETGDESDDIDEDDEDDAKIPPVTPRVATVPHPAKPFERINNMCWRTEMIYQALQWLGRDAIEIIAAYAQHTEIERFTCVLEDISRRGFNNLLIDAGFKYFETSLKLEWIGYPELPYDCMQYRFSVKCANSGRGLNIDGALEDVLPSRKHLFGLTRNAENKKENRKLRTAYRLKMAELFMRY